MSGPRTFSYGGGVQSHAALVLAAQGRIDFSTFLFANVGEDSENPKTVAYVRDIARPFAEAHGLDIVQLDTIRHGKVDTILGRIKDPGRVSDVIPVRLGNGNPMSRSCTWDFKREAIAKWQHAHGATAEAPAVSGMGISTDEIERMKSESGYEYQRLEYPLIDLELRRSDCAAIITKAGLPMPPKSDCWFCPLHTPRRWSEMRRDEPEQFWQSVKLERYLSDQRTDMGRDPVFLSRLGKPLDEAIGEAQSPLFGEDFEGCDEGYCGV